MNNLLKLSSFCLLLWYAVLRWMLLSASNLASQSWLANPFGSILAILTIVYLIVTLLKSHTNFKPFYFMYTILLWLLNFYCLFTMTNIFFKNPSCVNIGYEMLDILIVLFYSSILILYVKLKITSSGSNFPNLTVSKKRTLG